MKETVINRYSEEELRPRVMGKSELARMYFPDSSAHAAMVHLNRWIHRCTELEEKLREVGYIGTQRYFTGKQVELIQDYLGEP